MDPASYKESQFVIQFLVENQARFAMPQARQVQQHPAHTRPNKDDDITQQSKDKGKREGDEMVWRLWIIDYSLHRTCCYPRSAERTT